MKAYLILAALLLGGCSLSVKPNNTTVDTIEEAFEFHVTNKDIAIAKSIVFVNKIDSEYPKSTFVINYDTKESQFIDEFVNEVKLNGINKLRYTLNANSDNKGIKIIAKYHKLKEAKCDGISIKTIKYQPFGCSLEYNRRLSMTNPVLE